MNIGKCFHVLGSRKLINKFFKNLCHDSNRDTVGLKLFIDAFEPDSYIGITVEILNVSGVYSKTFNH